ncbi:MAG: response regulator transcription factor [Paludibacteraceae bacterium]|nr:response regulator transcription factor [Paludibacteraceae bacterium]
MADSSKRRILVVDDEEDLCEILRFNLENEGYDVDTALSAEEALNMDIKQYSLILLDVMMGKTSGFQMAKLLKQNEQTAKVPIIFLTARNSENDAVTGLTLGADDYIAKPFSLREVMLRVGAVIRRTAGDSAKDTESTEDKTVSHEGLVIDTVSKTVSVDSQIVAFTKIEYGLLLALLSHKDRVFSRQELIERAWPHDVVVLDRTVDVNITRLRKKIGRYADHITTRPGFGYTFTDKLA